MLYKLTFFVPESHLEMVKHALFTKGAGKFGDYDSYAWQTLGTGQFRPLVNSQPFLGETSQIIQLNEYKVETICLAEYIKTVLEELIRVHPYEQPAYEVYPIQTLQDL